MVASDLEGAREIIHRWRSFNQAEPSVAHLQTSILITSWVLAAAHVEKYSISFPVYMNKEAFQSVVQDRMFIHNHDFHRSDQLVCELYLVIISV